MAKMREMYLVPGCDGLRYVYDSSNNTVYSFTKTGSPVPMKWINGRVSLTRYRGGWPVTFMFEYFKHNHKSWEKIDVDLVSGHTTFNRSLFELPEDDVEDKTIKRKFIVMGEEDEQMLSDYTVINNEPDARALAENMAKEYGGEYTVLELLGTVAVGQVVWTK